MAPPTIDIIRHAEATHNILGSHIRDPPLTAAGRAQTRQLAHAFPYSRQVTHIVASPLRRTIETAIATFGESVLKAPAPTSANRISLLPELQEVNPFPSGTGSSPESLRAAFGNKLVDLTNLDSQWFLKGPDTAFVPDPPKVEERARKARVWLRGLARAASTILATTTAATTTAAANQNNNNNHGDGDGASNNGDGGGGGGGDDGPHIVVVTHGEFVHWLTDNFVGVDHRHNTGWWNAEFRSFQFADLDGDDAEAALVETARSRETRKFYSFGAEKPPTPAENARCKAIATKRVLAYAKVLKEEKKKEKKEEEEEVGEEWEDVISEGEGEEEEEVGLELETGR